MTSASVVAIDIAAIVGVFVAHVALATSLLPTFVTTSVVHVTMLHRRLTLGARRLPVAGLVHLKRRRISNRFFESGNLLGIPLGAEARRPVVAVGPIAVMSRRRRNSPLLFRRRRRP
jgi:hypothetical protein